MHKHPQNRSYVGSSGQTLATNVSMTLCDSQIHHQTYVLCGCTTFGTELKLGPKLIWSLRLLWLGQGRSLSAERWKVQQYVPTDRRTPSSSITRRSRDTYCPICPAKRHSSSSDKAPEAPAQFVRIGQVFLPTLNRNWVELAGHSKL